MKSPILLLLSALVSLASAGEAPKIFAGLFEKDIPVQGELGVVLPPEDFDKYVAKIRDAGRKDPKWFKEFTEKSKDVAILPFDEKLGLTKEEYADYVKLWGQREFKPMKKVMLLLRETLGNSWTVTATGDASCISVLRYDEKGDAFRSPNGELKRQTDIKAAADTFLGAWSGFEWKFLDENTLGKSMENFAIGRMEGNKYGLVLYRYVEISTEGKAVAEKDLVIRFALGKAGQVKQQAPPAKPAKPGSTR